MLSRVAVAVLTILLIVALLGANVAMGLDRGVLDDEYVKSELDDADVYAAVHAEALAQLEEDMPEAPDDLPGSIDVSDIIADTVTEEYLQEQIEGVIESIYAFLHGDTDQLELIITLDTIVENFEQAVATQVADISLAELNIGELSIPVEGYQVTVDPGELDAGETAYYAELDRFESDAKDAIEQSLEDQGFDPSEEDVDQAYETLKDDLSSELESAVEAAIEGADLPADLQDAATAIAHTVAGAYVDRPAHADFDADLTDHKEDLGAAAASFALDEQGDLIPEELDIGEELGGLAEEELEPAVTAVSLVSTLSMALIVVSLLLVGGMFAVTRSVASTARAAGIGALIVGALSAAVAFIIPGVAEDMFLDDLEVEGIGEELISVVPDLIDSAFGPLFTQSIGLLVIGGILIGVSVVYPRRLASGSSGNDGSA